MIIDCSDQADLCSIPLPKRYVSSAERRFGCDNINDEDESDEEEGDEVNEDLEVGEIEDGYDQSDDEEDGEEEEEVAVETEEDDGVEDEVRITARMLRDYYCLPA